MVLVDTNILAYLLIQGDRTAAAQALYERDPDWRSEAFIFVEFSNILATYVRSNLLTRDGGTDLLGEAQRRLSALVNVEHHHALDVATEFGISAYDARFISSARQMRTRLITEDARLRRAVPDWTSSLSDV